MAVCLTIKQPLYNFVYYENMVNRRIYLSYIISFVLILFTVFLSADIAKLDRDTTEIFEKNKKSVVYISTHSDIVDLYSLRSDRIPRGSGSGFVWSSDGYIVTNYHVIADSSGATVKLSNGKKYAAKLVGYDQAHDIAVLKIDIKNSDKLTPVSRGDSSKLKVGQAVFAIGNPFGLDWTMTSGIVSALERDLMHMRSVRIRRAIQTDAAINPGNSSGPLIDSKGDVIGINSAIYSNTGSFSGVSFAIPINIASRVISQIIKKGYYRPPTIGFYSDGRINRFMDRNYGIEGVAILGITADSSLIDKNIEMTRIFSDGEILFGDIITHINSHKVKSLDDIASELERYDKGDRMKLTVVGKKGKRTITIELK